MSWATPESFLEVRQKFRQPLRDAVYFYLQHDGEAARVTDGALEQAERQYAALDTEANPLLLLTQAAVDQCELLLPRKEGEPTRPVFDPPQILRHLENYRFERRVEEMQEAIASAQATFNEKSVDGVPEQAIALMQEVLDAMIRNFYNRSLFLEDEDGGAAGAMPVPVLPTPPQRGPGGGRTFEEALAAPRSP